LVNFMPAIKATAIILNYHKARQTVENVRSLNAQNNPYLWKIIVIDNSCDPSEAEVLKPLNQQENLVLLVNQKNIGYARAHRLVCPVIAGDYVLIANPDIVWRDPAALDKMIAYLDNHPDIGILGPKQINTDGQTAMTIRAWPKFILQVARRTRLRNWPVFRDRVAYDEMRHLDYGQIQDVDWLQSSCQLIRRAVWEAAGGFSCAYFLFMSDVEICYQAWARGYRVVYYPLAMVGADGRRASAGGFRAFFRNRALRRHVVDSLYYRLKHFWRGDPRQRYYRLREPNK